jgi:hypothetical protein
LWKKLLIVDGAKLFLIRESSPSRRSFIYKTKLLLEEAFPTRRSFLRKKRLLKEVLEDEVLLLEEASSVRSVSSYGRRFPFQKKLHPVEAFSCRGKKPLLEEASSRRSFFYKRKCRAYEESSRRSVFPNKKKLALEEASYTRISFS